MRILGLDIGGTKIGVAIGDRVYASLGYNKPLLELDAAAGETLQTYRGTDGTLEIHRRSLSDRWYCRIVLPGAWLPAGGAPLAVSCRRAHGDQARQREAGGNRHRIRHLEVDVQAAGAGGHAGVQSPFALVQEIRTIPPRR